MATLMRKIDKGGYTENELAISLSKRGRLRLS